MINFKSLKNDIPKPIRLFLGKAFLLFIIWKIVYNVFLYDSPYLDHPLTTNVADVSVYVLNNLGDMSGFTSVRETYDYILEGTPVEYESSAIYHHDNVILYIANVCNGLELMVLYVGFIICMPALFWRKIKYIILGLVTLHLINIIRCVGLIYLREYYHQYFDFAHHYLFNAMVYTGTLLIWMLFSRKINLKK